MRRRATAHAEPAPSTDQKRRMLAISGLVEQLLGLRRDNGQASHASPFRVVDPVQRQFIIRSMSDWHPTPRNYVGEQSIAVAKRAARVAQHSTALIRTLERFTWAISMPRSTIFFESTVLDGVLCRSLRPDGPKARTHQVARTIESGRMGLRFMVPCTHPRGIRALSTELLAWAGVAGDGIHDRSMALAAAG